MSKLIRSIAARWCSLRYGVFLLLAPLRAGRNEDLLLRHQQLLLAMLRSTPWWVYGHVSLCNLLLHRITREPLDPQPRAMLRYSAEASRRLVSHLSSKPNLEYWQAELVAARVYASEKLFGQALELLNRVISDGSSVLSLREYYGALEEAACCAKVLGFEKSEADRYLSLIPEQHRSVTLSLLR